MVNISMISSLALGILAWALPVINLIQVTKNKGKHWRMLSVISISACSIVLYLQIFYLNYLVKIEDIAAILDVTGATNFISALFLSVTLILNIITVITYNFTKSSTPKVKK